MTTPANSLYRFTPAASRTQVPLIRVEDIPTWTITRSYYDMKQHLTDEHYRELGRRLGCDSQTARRWVRGGWSSVMLGMVNHDDIMDEIAAGRSYHSIANELCVDELSLRRWVRRDPEALRAAEEYKAEIQIDRAKNRVALATEIGESKAAATLLTHAQWAAERLYRTKFKPNAEQASSQMTISFDLGGATRGRTIPGSAVQSGSDALPPVFGH